MTKQIAFMTVLSCVFFSVCICCAEVPDGQTVTEKSTPSVLGKDDPFAKISVKQGSTVEIAQTTPTRISRTVFAAPGSAETPMSELFAQTVTLKFLTAVQVQAAFARMLSEYGTIAVDTATNTLIISDTADSLERIVKKIREADKTPEQIVIEVAIIDVQLNSDTELGVNWDILSSENYNPAYRQSFGFIPRLQMIPESDITVANTTAFATTGLGGDLSIITGTVRNLIHMLQQKRDVEIIANPSVMVLSGQTASIEAGDEIPFNEIVTTDEGGILSSTSFKDVGVKLEVRAFLTDDQLICLDINAEQKVATGASDTGVPIADARKVNTALMLQDGQMVVLAGLRSKEITQQTNQIPILGDIPILGLLFKSTKNVENNFELVVLVSPHIYTGEPVDPDIASRFEHIRERAPLSLTPIRAN